MKQEIEKRILTTVLCNIEVPKLYLYLMYWLIISSSFWIIWIMELTNSSFYYSVVLLKQQLTDNIFIDWNCLFQHIGDSFAMNNLVFVGNIVFITDNLFGRSLGIDISIK